MGSPFTAVGGRDSAESNNCSYLKGCHNGSSVIKRTLVQRIEGRDGTDMLRAKPVSRGRRTNERRRMRAARKWRAPATIASLFALCTGALALTPGTAAASTHACGNHTVLYEYEAEPGKKSKINIPIKQIVSQGASCSAAFKLVNALYDGKSTSAKPEGYTCKIGKFKVPRGSVPEVCTKPGKKVQFAGKGG